MKIVIFFLFSFISYVFAGTPGPLGLAAKMPPYQPLVGGEFQLKSDLISESYSLEETLLFLSGGSGHNCEKRLLDACQDLKKAYDDSSPNFGFVLSIVCDYTHEACSKMTEVEQKLCNLPQVTYEDITKKEPLNSSICAELYTKCRLRSSGCSPEYSRQCLRLMSMCHRDYDLYDLYTVFLESIGFDLAPGKFELELEDLCRSLFNISDIFVQLCLDPASLKRNLGSFIKNRRQGRGDFFPYPESSIGALLKAQGLDGGLFSPRTRPGTDPEYLLGYLVGLFSHSSFMRGCIVVSQACFGLGFFPRTAPFCEINSHQASGVKCQEAEIKLMEHDIPKLRDQLGKGLWKGEYHGITITSGVDSDLCEEYLVKCSYLGGLDSELSDLCGFLRDYCSYALEIGSALSLFDYYFREQNKGKNSGHIFDTCEKDLRETCISKSNSSVDFLLFCYKPGHTCTALRTLNTLRCDKYKNRFTEYYPTEKLCVDTVYEYEPYMHRCGDYENFVYFFNKCLKKFPGNDYLESFSTKLEESSNLENEDSETDDEDDGF